MLMNLSASVWNYLCAYGDNADLAEAVGGICELGLGVELWLNWWADPSAVEPDQWSEIGKMLDGVHVSVHTAMKKWDSEMFRNEVEMAAFLGASVLVVHPNSLDLVPADGTSLDMQPCILAADYASSEGVVLALENLPEPGSIDVVRQALDASPRLRACIDMAHAYVAHYDIAEAVRLLGRKVVHIHVSDNMGDRDEHLIPGEGGIPEEAWVRAFAELAKLDYPGSIVMELRCYEPKRAAIAAESFLRKIAQQAGLEGSSNTT